MKSSPFAAIANLHDRFVHRRRVRVLAEQASQFVPRGARVLDVGSGDGSFGRVLVDRRPDVHVRGLDVVVRPRTAIRTEAFDGINIPHGDRSFDVVTLIDVLHHADDEAALLAEASRVADSRVLVKDVFRKGFGAQLTLSGMDWWANRPHAIALPYRYLTERQWLALFDEIGLEVEALLTSLRLYPAPFRWLFERSMHFMAPLRPAHGETRARLPVAGGSHG